MALSDCCLKGFRWDGEPLGHEEQLGENKAYISGANKDAAVMFIHDAFGWTFKNLRLLADHYAQEADATVYLPDFFGGEVLDSEVLASGNWQSLDMKGFMARNSKDARRDEIFSCAKVLRSQYKRIGVIGFCFGGWAVFQLGARGNNLVDCIATAHPSLLTKEEIDAVGVPVQILAPEHDMMFTPELREYANKKIPELQLPYDFQFFPGVTPCEEPLLLRRGLRPFLSQHPKEPSDAEAMASFMSSVMRLAFKRHPPEGRLDEEHAAATAGSVGMTSTLGGATFAPSQQTQHGGGGGIIYPSTASDDDPLTLFRLMLGITASPHLGFSAHGPAGTRPAPNVGLYARVVHSEQKAKDSYKVFSVVINACYFLQIIVAAALTAMGAAAVNSKAITAFGAINTIIAGFLTFLKGSGLPGRLKYFGGEWKKIREFIEQRERDFSRRGCGLDVHETVALIEAMYANTKRDIEMNTPDSFNSVSNIQVNSPTRIGLGVEPPHKIAGVDVSKIEGIMGKLKSLDGTIGNIKSRIEKKGHDVNEAAHQLQDDEKRAEEELQRLGKSIEAGIEEHKPRLVREMSHAVDEVTREAREQVTQRAGQVAADARTATERARDEAMAGVAREVRRAADDVDPSSKKY
ncbi:uncharacterized protein E0L32_011996 [Thyridium curvatum]|uniref:Dienelactone hydrolase domain-containing protein n=1 Tax=Thyridium curvatum TaxID=1093900 RepID=A0A507BEN3_9PEZI|nr:uncharacterized protein E0L32_011996 [Thyridium curvatum]TPX17933.1 hypothetical protein E0L32_011996 [Thyridium curvatum]